MTQAYPATSNPSSRATVGNAMTTAVTSKLVRKPAIPNSRAGIMDRAARPEPLSDILVGCDIVRVLTCVTAGAFSVPMESKRKRLQIFILTRFLDANRFPPTIKSEGMLRWKTLYSCLGLPPLANANCSHRHESHS
jgi:hypothetical protein